MTGKVRNLGNSVTTHMTTAVKNFVITVVQKFLTEWQKLILLLYLCLSFLISSSLQNQIDNWGLAGKEKYDTYSQAL